MRPSDFSATFMGFTGPLPPPHYSEHTIRIGPAAEGSLEMTAGYPGPGTPVWSERFPLTDAHLDWLFGVFTDQGLFAQGWRQRPDVPVGGGSEKLTVTAGGQQFVVPSFVDPMQQSAATNIFGAVRALLPPGLWDRIDGQRLAFTRQGTPGPYPGQGGAVATAPLFTELQIGGASFLATPFAGCVMLAMNATRLRKGSAPALVALGVVAGGAEVFINMAIKGNGNSGSGILSLLLGVAAGFIMRMMAVKLQGPDIASHLRGGGQPAPLLSAVGVIVGCFVVLVAGLTAVVMLAR